MSVSLGLRAQDSARVIQYTDTFRLQDQPTAFADDGLIWTTFQLQHRNRQLQDSVQMLLDSIARLQTSGYGISMADIDTVTLDSSHVAMADTITREVIRVEKLIAEEKRINQSAIEPSIFKDLQEDMDDLNRSLHQRRYWSRELNCLAQFTQNYISPNWYKGGNSSFAAFAQVKGFYNYKRDHIVWENTLDWKVGAATTGKSDTLRRYNITDDQFRVQSQFGYQVGKPIYVTGSVELNTTLWNAWNSNKKTVKTAFMTPLRFYINVGVDYRPVKKLSINFSPAVYKLTYACFHDPERVDITGFGLDQGKNLKNEFGSSIRIKYQWKPVREVTLDNDLYFYTNYRGVEFDWEIGCDFMINRFLSTRLVLHPRYCSHEINEGDSRAKLQFKELLSIGFSHKFR